jgi:Flp pilus assembly protein TadG
MLLEGAFLARSSRRSRRRDERGVSALELAFIAPGFLLLIFFTMQAALYFYGRNVAIQSAREGVSQLRLAQDEPTYENVRAGVISNTERFADSVGRGALTGSIAESTYDDAGGRAGMTVSGNVISLVPFLDLTVHEHAEGPVERFEGAGG